MTTMNGMASPAGAFADSFTTRIADLRPDDQTILKRHIEATVALIWPYSSSTGTLSLLLAEKDTRLRRAKGQVKIIFHYGCAREVAKSKVSIGDEIKLDLRNVSFVRHGEEVSTPGKKLEWDLVVRKEVRVEILRDSGFSIFIDYVSRSPAPHVADDATAISSDRLTKDVIDVTKTLPNIRRSFPFTDLGTYSSQDSTDSLVDPLSTVSDDGHVPGRGRKRTKFARHSGAWRLAGDEQIERGEEALSPSVDQIERVRQYSQQTGQNPLASTPATQTALATESIIASSPLSFRDQHVDDQSKQQAAETDAQIPSHEHTTDTIQQEGRDSSFEMPPPSIVPEPANASGTPPSVQDPSPAPTEPSRSTLMASPLPAPRLSPVQSLELPLISPLVQHTVHFPDISSNSSGFNTAAQTTESGVMVQQNGPSAEFLIPDELTQANIADANHASAIQADDSVFPAAGGDLDTLLGDLQDILQQHIDTQLPLNPLGHGSMARVVEAGSSQDARTIEQSEERALSDTFSVSQSDAVAFERVPDRVTAPIGSGRVSDEGGRLTAENVEHVNQVPRHLTDEGDLMERTVVQKVFETVTGLFSSDQEHVSNGVEDKPHELQTDHLSHETISMYPPFLDRAQDAGMVVDQNVNESVTHPTEQPSYDAQARAVLGEQSFVQEEEMISDESAVAMGPENELSAVPSPPRSESEPDTSQQSNSPRQLEGFADEAPQPDLNSPSAESFGTTAFDPNVTPDATQDALPESRRYQSGKSFESFVPAPTRSQNWIRDGVPADTRLGQAEPLNSDEPSFLSVGRSPLETPILTQSQDAMRDALPTGFVPDQTESTPEKELLSLQVTRKPGIGSGTPIMLQTQKSDAILTEVSSSQDMPLSEGMPPSPQPQRSSNMGPAFPTQTQEQVQDPILTEPPSSREYALDDHKSLSSPVAEAPSSPSTGTRRTSTRLLQKAPTSEKLTSIYFTPRRSVQQPALTVEEQPNSRPDSLKLRPPRLSLPEQTVEGSVHSPVEQSQPFDTQAPEKRKSFGILAPKSPRGLSTQLSYYTPLAAVSEHLHQSVDILAICSSKSTEIEKARSGPKDYHTTLHVVDPSMSDEQEDFITPTIVQLFRPYKKALPTTQRGDAVLLRNVKVDAYERRHLLLSTASSAWAIFRADSSNRSAFSEITVSGPPIEHGYAEAAHVRQLLRWWDVEGEKRCSTQQNQSTQRSLAPTVPSSPAQSSLDFEAAKKSRRRSDRIDHVGTEVRTALHPSSEVDVESLASPTSFRPSSPATVEPPQPSPFAAKGESGAMVHETVEPPHANSPTRSTRRRKSNVSFLSATTHDGPVASRRDSTAVTTMPYKAPGEPASFDGRRSESVIHELRDGTTYIDIDQYGKPYRGETHTSDVRSEHSVELVGDADSKPHRESESEHDIGRRSGSGSGSVNGSVSKSPKDLVVIHELRDGVQYIDD